MLSGVIFVALALLWALFLIPKALRSHDEAARPRSVESTSDHARVLHRRDGVADPVTGAVTDAVTEVPAAPVAGSRPAPQPVTVPEQRRPSARALTERRRRQAAAAARRRRRVLGLLLGVTVVVAVLAGTGVLLPWAPAVPVVVVAGFLVVARATVRGERRRWESVRTGLAEHGAQTMEPTEQTTSQVAEAAQPVLEAAATWQSGPVLVPVPRNEQGVALVSDVEDTSAFSAAALAEAVGASGQTSTLWDPLPVTLPTYVGKPRATRSVRTIDLNAAGVSSSGRNAADSALVAESATAGRDEQGGQGRRVVGG